MSRRIRRGCILRLLREVADERRVESELKLLLEWCLDVEGGLLVLNLTPKNMFSFFVLKTSLLHAWHVDWGFEELLLS